MDQNPLILQSYWAMNRAHRVNGPVVTMLKDALQQAMFLNFPNKCFH